MKTKKIMALLMASAMVMGTLAGCGGNTDTAETTQPQGESVSTAETADTAKTETTETASGREGLVWNRGWQDYHLTVLGWHSAGIWL